MSFAVEIKTKFYLPVRTAVLTLLLMFAWPFTIASGQSLPGLGGNETAKVEATGAEQVAQRLATAQQEIAALSAGAADGEEQTADSREHKLNRLKQIGRLLEQQLAIAKPVDSISPLDSARVSEDSVSVFSLNNLYELRAGKVLELADRRAALIAAKEKLDKAQRSHAKLKAITSSDAPTEGAGGPDDLKLSQLGVRLLEEEVNLAVLQVREITSGDHHSSGLDSRIERLRSQLALGRGSIAEGILQISQRRAELSTLLAEAERAYATLDIRLQAAQNRFTAADQQGGVGLDKIEAISGLRETIGGKITLLTAELERVSQRQAIWVIWHRLLSGDYTREELKQWLTDTSGRRDALQLEEAQRKVRFSATQSRYDQIDGRLSSLPADSQLRPILAELTAETNSLRSEQLAALRAIEGDIRFTGRVVDDVKTSIGNKTLRENLTTAYEAIANFWKYEITTIDDAPFTVGSLTIGLLLFIAGLWISKRAASFVGQTAENRFRVEAGAAQALQTLSFYIFLVGITLLALRTVHFPLTAFTVLGGALAIGIGFGSQNVMNNFISGLILMLERPVRARDVVEVDGNHGTIEKIGARSTQIRSTDGRHIVVPNSFFLESNVINWTLSDDLIRTRVSVGVAYGSPTRLVKELIQEILSDYDQALNSPPPNIIFDEFGDNSLNFDVYFWVHARSPMAARETTSEVRFRIDDAFRENHLVIAFPQRDVHLDAAAPIDVRVVRDPRPSG